MKFRIADDLVLGAPLVVSTIGIFATKGMGKSFLAQVIAEELLEHQQVIVVIDPTDVWSGLRSSADGKRDGYPILVIGGDHGDLKLEPEPGAGTRLAEAIVAERFSCVICTDGLDDTRAIRYVREVLETLYRKNREPIHVFVDECDLFAPQQSKEEEDYRCIRALSHVVRRGRKKGIGSTLITQRPSELNASVRSQVEMLFVLGMLHHLDIDAVEKWLRLRKKKRGDNAAFELQEQMIDSLDSLQQGDAWVWAPRLKIHKRFRARTKRTFDSGATPRPGQKSHQAKKLAPVDIARLGAAIAAAAQRMKDNDPKALKEQVAALRRELERVGKGQDRAESNEKANHAENFELRAEIAELKKRGRDVVEKPVLKDGQLARTEQIVARAESVTTGVMARLEKTIDDVRETFGGAIAKAEQAIGELSATIKLAAAPALHQPPPQPPQPPPRTDTERLDKSTILWTPGLGKTQRQRAAQDALVIEPAASVEASYSKGDPLHHAYVTHPPSPDGLAPARLRILSAIAWWEAIGIPEPDLAGIAFVADTSTKSSAFINNRARLRAVGYITYVSPGRVRLTAEGRKIAPLSATPPTTKALHEVVLGKVEPAVGRLLKVLIAAYPGELSLEDLAQRAGTTTGSSAFINNRAWLHARGLADYPRSKFVCASKLLFPEVS